MGLNYRDHAREAGMEIPAVPTIFNKFSNVVIGPGAPIVLPKNSTRPDYEAEFAFVIGTGGRHISAADALDHVFGYTIVNDVSARDFQMATSQWLMGKTFDTFAPMGPWIVTRDEIADPHALDISLEIGGEILQHSNTRELVFGVPALIEYISSVVTLEPGDIVATGTPAGVGFARKPPRYLRAGDEVVIRIQGIGELRNPVIAERLTIFSGSGLFPLLARLINWIKLGGRLTVRLRPLEPRIGVRIPASQPLPHENLCEFTLLYSWPRRS